jgi:hypothetical protein
MELLDARSPDHLLKVIEGEVGRASKNEEQ